MEDDDPFASITQLINISTSQNDHLRHCRFAGEPDDEPVFFESSGEPPVESAGIVMVSPPETPEEKAPSGDGTPHVDVFRTPPEESAPATSQELQPAAVDLCDDRAVAGEGHDGGIVVADCAGGSDAVDLGRDTDLGFSLERESTQRIEKDSELDSAVGVDETGEREVIEFESVKNSVYESPSKKLKIGENILRSETPMCSLGTEAEKILEILEKSVEILKSVSKGSQNLGIGTSRGSARIKPEKVLERLVKSMGKLKSPLQLSKILDKSSILETPKGCLDAETDRRNDLGKPMEQSNPERESLCNNGLKSLEVHQIEETLALMSHGEKECREESLTKRMLDFSTEELEFDCGEDNTELRIYDNRVEGISNEKEVIEINELPKPNERHAAQKSIDDIKKFRYVGPSCSNSCEKEKAVRAKRSLPVSMCGKENDKQGDTTCHEVYHKEVTLLDVLQMLARNSYHDPSLERLSILEAAKRRGLTFP